MISFKEFIKESEELLPSTKAGTMSLWHGGNLDDAFDETIAHKKGRWEYGPGLYLTTNYSTAAGYSKGSRKLYLVTIEKGNDAKESSIGIDVIKTFIKENVLTKKQKTVLESVEKRNKDGKIDADIFINIIINNEAVKSTNSGVFKNFLVNNNIDYQLVPNAFGWGETMIVLFNMKKLINKQRVGPKDKITIFDLPTKFN